MSSFKFTHKNIGHSGYYPSQNLPSAYNSSAYNPPITKIKSELELLFEKYFPHLDVKIILANTFAIGSFLTIRTLFLCVYEII